jgi:hypothetical protein
MNPSSRQRVATALNFQPVDRVPLDLNLSHHAYLKLCARVGVPAKPLPKPSLAMEVCVRIPRCSSGLASMSIP